MTTAKAEAHAIDALNRGADRSDYAELQLERARAASPPAGQERRDRERICA